MEVAEGEGDGMVGWGSLFLLLLCCGWLGLFVCWGGWGWGWGRG